MLGQNETIKNFQGRFPILFYIILVAFALLLLRLIKLQVVGGQQYRVFSESNSLRQEKIPGPRGQVFDRNGKPLVANRLQLDIVIVPQFATQIDETFRVLSEISGETSARLKHVYDRDRRINPPFHPVRLIRNAPWEVVARIESLNEGLPGVSIESSIRRTYLDGPVGAQVYGYIGEVNDREIRSMAERSLRYQSGDFIGKDGVERQWERYLRGRDGVRHMIVNAHNRRAVSLSQEDSTLLNLNVKDQEPLSGNDLILTIDQELQQEAARAMDIMMGATVALNPKTGEVLAMISNPSQDHTDLAYQRPEFWEALTKNSFGPLRNKAIQDHYPPGSTFKIVTGLAALNHNLISPETILMCPPTLRFGNRTYHDHNQSGFGRINLQTAIQRSSNVFFWQLAMRLDVDQIAETARALGLGKRTGIDLPNEIPGLMPTEAWKKETTKEPWFKGETLSVSIGQGATLVTPLQMALSYATIANRGVLYQPYLVQKVVDADGKLVKSFEPKMLGKATDVLDNIDVVKKGLYDVVNTPGGTAYHFGRLPDIKIAGKSGTVQVSSRSKNELFKKCHDLPFSQRHHAWFVGFAPFDDPEIVVASFGLHECGGSRTASPVVKAVISKYFEIKNRGMPQPKPASL